MKKNYQNLSDELLMQSYQHGDIMAYETLYFRHSKRVYAYLQKRVGKDQSADLLQEVFLKLHNSKHLFNNDLPFLPWLFTISKSVCIDAIRKNSKMKSVTFDENFDLAIDVNNEPKLHHLNEMIGNLPKDQQSAIALRYLEEWSFQDIATKLGTTPENSRKIISRGIKKLKTLFLSKKDRHERE